MKLLKAKDIKRFDNWTALIYAEPGKGKTTMLKTIKGRTLLFSIDGMYHVLEGLEDIDIVVLDPKEPAEGLGKFYRYLIKHLDDYDNIVIDNLSTFQHYWLNAQARTTKSGMPEMRDYGVITRVVLDFISSLKDLQKNLLILAHEKKVEITRSNGGTYTQFQPDVRGYESVMGIIPLVGRLVVVRNQETNQLERVIALQSTESTLAKDQLIGDRASIGQMELLPLLQS